MVQQENAKGKRAKRVANEQDQINCFIHDERHNRPGAVCTSLSVVSQALLMKGQIPAILALVSRRDSFWASWAGGGGSGCS